MKEGRTIQKSPFLNFFLFSIRYWSISLEQITYVFFLFFFLLIDNFTLTRICSSSCSKYIYKFTFRKMIGENKYNIKHIIK